MPVQYEKSLPSNSRAVQVAGGTLTVAIHQFLLQESPRAMVTMFRLVSSRQLCSVTNIKAVHLVLSIKLLMEELAWH